MQRRNLESLADGRSGEINRLDVLLLMVQTRCDQRLAEQIDTGSLGETKPDDELAENERLADTEQADVQAEAFDTEADENEAAGTENDAADSGDEQ